MSVENVRIGAVTIDSVDPDSLIPFWTEIAGVEVAERYPDYIFTTKIPGNHIRLAFQRVPEEKSSKNRLHLDMSHPDREALIARILELGGSRIADRGDEAFSWTVLADPEGNEFCVADAH